MHLPPPPKMPELAQSRNIPLPDKPPPARDTQWSATRNVPPIPKNRETADPKSSIAESLAKPSVNHPPPETFRSSAQWTRIQFDRHQRGRRHRRGPNGRVRATHGILMYHRRTKFLVPRTVQIPLPPTWVAVPAGASKRGQSSSPPPPHAWPPAKVGEPVRWKPLPPD